MDAARIDQRRKARHLANEVASVVDKAKAHFVLVTSVARGDGKTRLAGTLKKELGAVAVDRYVVLTWKQLGTFHPSEFDLSTVVFVDGPAMLEGEEILQIPPDWMEAFDGALLVVMKRETTRADLDEAVSWLTAAGIPPIGVVWNEHRFPPFGTALQRFRDSFRGLFRRRGLDAGEPTAELEKK